MLCKFFNGYFSGVDRACCSSGPPPPSLGNLFMSSLDTARPPLPLEINPQKKGGGGGGSK